MKAPLAVGLLLTITAELAGCSPSPQASTAHPSPAATLTTSAPTAYPTPPASTQSDNPGYAQAGSHWRHGQTVSAAVAPDDWFQAAAELEAGLGTDAKARSDQGKAVYAVAIRQLRDLISLPVANETPAQQAQTRSDAEGLNTFFGTPGLYF